MSIAPNFKTRVNVGAECVVRFVLLSSALLKSMISAMSDQIHTLVKIFFGPTLPDLNIKSSTAVTKKN